MAAAVLGPTLTSSGKPWEAAPGRRPGGLRGHPDRPRRPHNGQGDTGGLRVRPAGGCPSRYRDLGHSRDQEEMGFAQGGSPLNTSGWETPKAPFIKSGKGSLRIHSPLPFFEVFAAGHSLCTGTAEMPLLRAGPRFQQRN